MQAVDKAPWPGEDQSCALGPEFDVLFQFDDEAGQDEIGQASSRQAAHVQLRGRCCGPAGCGCGRTAASRRTLP